MTQILGIGASPRKKGNSDILIQHFLKGAKSDGATVKSIHLRNVKYGACIGCEKCRTDGACTGLQDEMQQIYPYINKSQGLVFVSPTHHYNVTAWMKAFIDRLYCYYDFTNDRPRRWKSRLAGQNRKAIIAAVCEQSEQEGGVAMTLEAMRLPLVALGYEIIDEIAVNSIFDKGKIADDPALLQNVEAVRLQQKWDKWAR